MDVVRYYLALSVVIAHFNFLTGHSIPWPTSSYSAVGGFFALSGYLIFHSYLKRPHLKTYIISRMRRILPPYFFIVILCAIGLVFTSSLSPGEYFTDGGFFKYLCANLSFLNFLHPTLPGVFDSGAFIHNSVNGSLWTMKIEWILYLSIPLVYYAYRRFRWDKTKTFVGIIIVSVAYRFTFYHLYANTGNQIYLILSRQVFGQLCYFYTGVIVYFHYDTFKRLKLPILAICLALMATSGYIPYYAITIQPFVDALLTLWVSLIGSWGYKISRHDNVSYDMYLFHFPVIQVCILLGINNLSPALSLSIMLAVTIILSVASWNLVGKRFAKIKTGGHKLF